MMYEKRERSNLELKLEILRATANEPVLPTPLMGKLNISWKLMNRYADDLEKRGLLCRRSPDEVNFRVDKRTSFLWEASEEGKRIIREWDSRDKILKILVG